MKYLLPFFLALLISVQLFGQCSLKINGRVEDLHLEEVLDYATIYLPELQRGVVADEEGKFAVDGICKGVVHLEISHIGCESKTFIISIVGDTSMVFKLEHHEELLSEVLIQEHNHDHALSQAVYSISGDKLRQLKGHSLADIAAIMPGVDIIKTGANISKPIIQGLSGNRIAIVTDGVILESQQWGIDHAPEVDGNGADKLSVIKSSAPILYGTQAMGGVIVVESDKTPVHGHIHGEVSSQYQTNGRAVSLNSRLQKSIGTAYVKGTMSYKKSGDQKAADYFLNNTGLNEYAGGLKIGNVGNNRSWEAQATYFSQNIGILRGAHIGNVTDLQSALKQEVPFFTEPDFSYEIASPRQNVNHFMSKIDFSQNLNNTTFIKFHYNFQQNSRKEYDVRRGNRSEIPIIDLKLSSQLFTTFIEHAGKQNTSSGGIQFKFQDNDNVPGTGSLPLIPDYIASVPSAFYQFKRNTGHALLESGLRYEFYDYRVNNIINRKVVKSHKTFNAGAINVGYTLSKKQSTLKWDLSFIGRAPMVNELYNAGLHQGIGALEFGDSTLTLEKSLKTTLDLKQDLGKYGILYATLYGQKVKDFVYFVPEQEPQLTVRGAFLVYRYKNTDAAIRGLDLLHVVNISKNFEWSNKMAFIRSINTILKEEIVLTPPFRVESAINYAFSLSHKNTNSFNTNASISYAARQNHVNPSSDFSPAPAAYTLVNIGLGYETKLFKHALKMDLQVQNLFNIKYRNYLNRLRYFSDDLGRNISFQLSYKI